MEPTFTPVPSPHAARVWREVLVPLADALSADLGAIAIRVVGEIRDAFPALFPDADAFEANRAATEQNLALIIQFVRDGVDPDEVAAPPAGIAYVREAVRRGVPLEAMLRSLRLGHRSFLAVMLERLRERTDGEAEFAEATMLLTGWSFGTVDRLSTQADVIYQDERDRWLRSAAATQTETIQTLLDGGDLDLQAAGSRLRYPLERNHVGLIAWVPTSTEDRDTFAALEAAVTQAAACVGGQSLLLQPLGLLATAVWVGSPTPFDPAVLDDVRFDAHGAPGVALAVGEPAAGVGGFSATHRQAIEARRVAMLDARPAAVVTRYRDVALSALATVDLDQARGFVAGELGGLAAADPTTRRLAATLAAYLDEGSSHARTARRLDVHENTVRYRIRQAQEVLGRPVDQRTLELRAALRLAGAIGTA